MFNIGYTTGTFDLTHEGHFRLLEAAKKRCLLLVVGLTTDREATANKRRPFMDYKSRRCILENCKWVDTVVPNDGRSKEDDYKRLKFDVVFIGDDYINHPQYTEFKECPVVYLPRTAGVSTTSKITAKIQKVKIHEPFSTGVNSILFKSDNTINKYVYHGSIEHKNQQGENNWSDVYNLNVPFPRNWKRIGSEKIHPNVSGVNSYRELEANRIFRGSKIQLIFKKQYI